VFAPVLLLRLSDFALILYFAFYLLNLQATKNLPDFKKDDQKAIDAELIKAIEAVPELKNYLGARFSLRDGDKPHEMSF
jgi:hypothetical protein